MTSFDEVVYKNKQNYKNYTFNVCNEVIMTVPIVFFLNPYLTEIINEKIDALKSAGLIDYFISKYLDPKYLRLKNSKQGPRKLNLKEVLIAFQLLAYGSVLSLVVFGVESMLNRFLKK